MAGPHNQINKRFKVTAIKKIKYELKFVKGGAAECCYNIICYLFAGYPTTINLILHMLPKENKETKCLCLIHPLRIYIVIIKYMSMRKYRNTVYGNERWCTFNYRLFKIHVANVLVDPLPCVNLSNL